MYAFSGKNGAGKSTFLKAAWIIQKAHFLKELNDPLKVNEFTLELKRYLNSEDSYIKIGICQGQESSDITLSWREKSKKFYGKSYSLEYSNYELVSKIWNTELPSNLILFVDASKSFSEETLKFSEINIEENKKSSLALEIIFNPEYLFSGIYRQLVRDYVHNRLIPNKPDRLFYHQVSSKIFSALIPNVAIKNFSGNHNPGEFVLLGKANEDRHIPLYDVREFSSGEKALLSTLTFLCISKSVNVLIIDEPENHFHESLLLEFINMLYDLCEEGGMLSWLDKTDIPGKAKLKSDWLTAEYENHALNQVFISTHSKSLIYKFFSIGQNFIINRNISVISHQNAENELRKVGLSSTYSKVILVEGEGDSDALEYILRNKNITIKPLNGSSVVIETFKKLAAINRYIQDSEFVFLVDSDNKDGSYFQELREMSPGFYDKTFIRLSKHEFENYLLDSKAFKRVMDKYLDLSGSEDQRIDVNEIHEKLIEIALESFPQVYKKETSLVLQQAIEKHFARLIWGDKRFQWNSVELIQSQLESKVFSEDGLNSLKDDFQARIQQVFDMYRRENRDNEAILSRCDGKQVFGKACGYFSRKVGVDNKKFKQAIIKDAVEREDSEVSTLIKEIIKKFSF